MIQINSNIVDLSHELILKSTNKNIAIDATCGNGHDTLFLSNHFDQVYSFDIQPLAIRRTQKKIRDITNITLINDDFNNIPKYIPLANLILFNLGFLPGSDKKINTKDYHAEIAILSAYKLLIDGSMIICCYTAHDGGIAEYERIISALNQQEIKYQLYDNFTNEEKLIYIKK